MPAILVTDPHGAQEPLPFSAGDVLMEVLRNKGFDDLPALCGGCCACATCQVYIDPAWLGRLPAIGEEEEEMLGTADGRRDTSRLSCQIVLDDALDGLPVTIGQLA